MSEKIIRDPVHDVICFNSERPTEVLLFRLLGAAEFQRLRRIRQLGFAHLAYPGADHCRYAHCLGVMETARRMLQSLRRVHEIDEGEELVCLAAALLHDLGHGPFSHVFESVTGIHHESTTLSIVNDPDSDVHRILAEHDKTLPAKVAALLQGQTPSLYRDILAGQLDADRLDYLLRDNLMTGSRYGDYDLNWLLHALTVDENSGRLAVTWKGVSAVEAYLQARYHMYRNVYFHKVVRSAEGMVKLAFQRAKRLAVQDRLPGPSRESAVFKALRGQRLSSAEFTDLDDVSILHCFKMWAGCDDAPLAGLCRGLLFRRLYKTIDLSQLDSAAATAARQAAYSAVISAGGDDVYDLFYEEPADTAYAEEGSASEILVKDSAGRLTSFAQLSPLPRALGPGLMFRRLHVAPAYRDIALNAVSPV
jgi:HD superfamily phosphohydrolase